MIQQTRRVATMTALATAGSLGLLSLAASPAAAETEVDRPDSFTSAFTVQATPDQVIGPEGDPAPGEEGATGTFSYMINSDEEVICYDIELRGVTGEYESAAKTATHIHEAVAGENGPPRLSFPNPEGDADLRTSSGCLQGPFTTGLEGDDGADTGEGFELSQIEANPAGFTSDAHTDNFVPGVVRGQLEQMPVGGVDTGLGGAAAGDGIDRTLVGATAVGALGIAAAAAVVVRRRRA